MLAPYLCRVVWRRSTRDARPGWPGALTALALLAVSTAPAAATPAAGPTQRVSITATGGQANGGTFAIGFSSNGRYQLMSTFATNLVGGVGGSGWDRLALRDQQTGKLQRVDVDSSGSPGTGVPGISFASFAASGRFVLFSTDRDGLTPDDHNGRYDMFVRDVVAGTTTRLRVGVGGTLADDNAYDLGISSDGRYVLFLSFATNLLPGGSNEQHIYVHDRQLLKTVQVDGGRGGAIANGLSYGGSLSADGRRAAFYSDSSNLVPNDSNGKLDVFVRDLTTGTTTMVSSAFRPSEQSNGGSQDPVISADGAFVAFDSTATNLVSSDTNRRADVFVRDLARGVTELISIGSKGRQANRRSGFAQISSDGRYVAFGTLATNLGSVVDTNNDFDVFVRDRSAGSTRRVSVARTGDSPNERSVLGFVATNGTVFFESLASNLVRGDTNDDFDTFIREPAP
jgi:hypothetical protein